MTAPAPSRVTIARGTQSDRTELLAANRDNRAHHYPWVEPFTGDAGFDTWLARTLTGPNLGLIAREATIRSRLNRPAHRRHRQHLGNRARGIP
jgi:hypothetical protein